MKTRLIMTGAGNYVHGSLKHPFQFVYARAGKSNVPEFWNQDFGPFAFGGKWFALYETKEGQFFVGAWYAIHSHNDPPRYFPSKEAALVYLAMKT